MKAPIKHLIILFSLILVSFSTAAQDTRQNLLKILDECKTKIASLEQLTKELNRENDNLKNHSGEINAKIKFLEEQVSKLKGEPQVELSQDKIMEQRLNLIVPRFRFIGKLKEVYASLEKLSVRMDPYKKGVKIKFTDTSNDPSPKKFNFDFENMPVKEIIRYTCIAAGLSYKVEVDSIIVESK